VYPIEAAHNPEVAGSNPAPATEKGPGNGAFRVLHVVDVRRRVLEVDLVEDVERTDDVLVEFADF
jgi:hypothetical protein